MRLSFRTSQLLVYTIVVALTGVFTIYAGFSFISETVVKEAKLRVQMDLNSAWSAYHEQKMLVQVAVCGASQHEDLRRLLIEGTDAEWVTDRLENLRSRKGLDFLILIDRNGIALPGPRTGTPDGWVVGEDPVITRALEGQANNGTVLISHEELMLKSTELAQRAYIALVKTERARPTDRHVENRGMALKTAVPIIGEDDVILGCLCGGILLNRSHNLVDRIRNSVFGDKIYQGKPLGTVTIFLWDVRIATNVIKVDTTRAIGTRVSDEVYEQVLERGERFGDRAFVVNDWYLSAYDPIRDPSGNIIGILYVGLLEKKYLDLKSSLAMDFLGVSFLALLCAICLAFFLSGNLRRPILRLVRATRELSAGKLDARVSSTGGIREMQELANSFNSMAGSLETRSSELERTSLALQQAYTESDEKNRAYLEMLGFVTHELKSPLASIVFAIGSLREEMLGPLTETQRSTLKAAASSADYLNYTIANYLNLSRIDEGELKLKLTTVMIFSDIINPVIQRLSELASDHKMRITCNVPAGVEVSVDCDLLTTVFQNLLSNAIKYGSEGGEIVIGFSRQVDSMHKINVFNEGLGFELQTTDDLFTKFSRFHAENYNTKSGTGLGLFVTKKIIERHGGQIWAETEPGKWANFIFTLPK